MLLCLLLLCCEHFFLPLVSGETLEVEMSELTKGLQDIQKDIEEFSATEEQIPGDLFGEIMTVSKDSLYLSERSIQTP